MCLRTLYHRSEVSLTNMPPGWGFRVPRLRRDLSDLQLHKDTGPFCRSRHVTLESFKGRFDYARQAFPLSIYREWIIFEIVLKKRDPTTEVSHFLVHRPQRNEFEFNPLIGWRVFETSELSQVIWPHNTKGKNLKSHRKFPFWFQSSFLEDYFKTYLALIYSFSKVIADFRGTTLCGLLYCFF